MQPTQAAPAREANPSTNGIVHYPDQCDAERVRLERQAESLVRSIHYWRGKCVRAQLFNLLLGVTVMVGGLWHVRETYLTPKNGKAKEAEVAPDNLPAAFFQTPAAQNPVIPAHAHDHPPRYRTEYSLLKDGSGFTVNGVPIIPPEQTYRYSPPQGRQHQFPFAAGKRVKKGEMIVTYADPIVISKMNGLKTAEARLQAAQSDLDYALMAGSAGSPQERKTRQNAVTLALASVAEAKIDLESASGVRAPFDGTVSYPLNEERTATVEITGDRVEVITYLPLEEIRKIQKRREDDGYGYTVAIKGDREWTGSIAYVGQRAEKNLFEVRIAVTIQEDDLPLPTEHIVSLTFTPTP